MSRRLSGETLCKAAILATSAGSPALAQDPAGVVSYHAVESPPPVVAGPPPPRKGHPIGNFFHRLHGKNEEFYRPPLGTDLYNVNNVQVANGDAARMVLHEFDFVDGTSELTDRGKYRLAWIARQIPKVPAPIFIEATPYEPGLDESRRRQVEVALSGGSEPLLPGTVRVGRPYSRALMGIEAEFVQLNRVGSIEAKSPPVGSSAGPGPFAGGAAGSTPGAAR